MQRLHLCTVAKLNKNETHRPNQHDVQNHLRPCLMAEALHGHPIRREHILFCSRAHYLAKIDALALITPRITRPGNLLRVLEDNTAWGIKRHSRIVLAVVRVVDQTMAPAVWADGCDARGSVAGHRLENRV